MSRNSANDKKGVLKRQLVMDLVVAALEVDGVGPTLRELAAHLKVSLPTAKRHVEQLIRMGQLRRSGHRLRSLLPVGFRVRLEKE